MSNRLADICVLLVKQFYGDLNSRVFEVIISNHELSLQQIVHRAKLPTRYVSHALVALIQQNLLFCWPRDGSSTTLYQANFRWAYELIRCGKHIELVRSRYGSEAAELVSNVQYLGNAREAELVSDVKHTTKGSKGKAKASSSVDDSAGSGVGSSRDPIEVEQAEKSSKYATPFDALRDYGYLERIGDFTNVSDLDFDNVVQAYVKRRYREFRDSTSGSKKGPKFRALVDSKKVEFLQEFATLEQIRRDAIPEGESRETQLQSQVEKTDATTQNESAVKKVKARASTQAATEEASHDGDHVGKQGDVQAEKTRSEKPLEGESSQKGSTEKVRNDERSVDEVAAENGSVGESAPTKKPFKRTSTRNGSTEKASNVEGSVDQATTDEANLGKKTINEQAKSTALPEDETSNTKPANDKAPEKEASNDEVPKSDLLGDGATNKVSDSEPADGELVTGKVATDEAAKEEVSNDKIADGEAAKTVAHKDPIDETANDQAANDQDFNDEDADKVDANDDDTDGEANEKAANHEVARQVVAKEAVTGGAIAENSVTKDKLPEEVKTRDFAPKKNVAKDIIATEEVSQLESAVDTATASRKSTGSGTKAASRKRKPKTTVDLSSTDKLSVQGELYFRLNPSKLLLSHRTNLLTEFARARIGDNFAEVYKCFLLCLETKLKWVRGKVDSPFETDDDNANSDVDKQDLDGMVESTSNEHTISWPTTNDVLRRLDAETIVAMRMELDVIYCDPNQIVDVVGDLSAEAKEEGNANEALVSGHAAEAADTASSQVGARADEDDPDGSAKADQASSDTAAANKNPESATYKASGPADEECGSSKPADQSGELDAPSEKPAAESATKQGKRKAVEEPKDQPSSRRHKVNGDEEPSPEHSNFGLDGTSDLPELAAEASGKGKKRKSRKAVIGDDDEQDPAPAKKKQKGKKGAKSTETDKSAEATGTTTDNVADDEQDPAPTKKKQKGKEVAKSTETDKRAEATGTTTDDVADDEKSKTKDDLPIEEEEDHNVDDLSDLEVTNRYLSIIAADPTGFLYEVAHKGSRQWNVHFEKIISTIAQLEIDRAVQARFGLKAVLILRILKQDGQKMMEHQVCDRALMNVKELRPIMMQLLAAKFVLVQEVPKDKARVPKSIVYLSYYNFDRCRSFLLDDIYFSMVRLFQRLDAEKEKVQTVLDKVESLGIQGSRQKPLTTLEKRKLANFRATEDKVLVQLARLDDLVMLWRDFLPPSVDVEMLDEAERLQV